MSLPLLDLPQTKTVISVRPTSLCDKLAAFFEQHPNTWIDGERLGAIAGKYAWRTRVSDLRKRGMTIENRQRYTKRVIVMAGEECPAGTYTVSEYRYVPAESQQEGAA